MFSTRKIKQMNPPPPPTLSKEFSRVWIGWCMIGDREVAREAAAKGVYISLALQFIATRKEWDHSDVERWFKSEILAWVYQLLEQKQIFKASHILTNIGIDPIEQLSSILSESTNKNVRDYIAEHLSKNGKLEASLLNSWKFLTAIEKYNSLTFNKIWDDISSISISKIDNKSVEWKANIATVLFFNTYDFCLENFLSPEYAWNNLLSNEKVDIIKIWINVYFSKDLNYKCNHSLTDDIFIKLKNIFLLWEISNAMINDIKQQTSYSKTIADFVLNELSKYGIFTEDEQKNVPNILSRFTQTQNIQNILNILQEPTSFLSISEFYEQFNVFCVQHELYEVLTECSKAEINLPHSIKETKELSLWLKRKETIGEELNDDNIRKNIIIALNYFADNLESYIREQLNPILLIAIIIFTRDDFLTDIINNKLSLNINDVTFKYDDIIGFVKQLPVFNRVLEKFSNNTEQGLDFYVLVQKYSGLNEIFDFRTNSSEIPNCDNDELTKKYGITKEIDCTFYIRQNRPSIAAKKLLLTENQTDRKSIVKKTRKLALNKFEIMPSCISFLEMIGESTEELRTIISAVNTINSSGLVLKENATELFSNIKENSRKILDILETIVMQNYKCSNIEEMNFTNIIKDYELPIRFASIHNLKYPEIFLICCTEKNLWFQFLVFVQHFSYPVDQVLKLSMDFKNKEIMEHVYHALSADIDFEDEDVANTFTTSITSFDYETNLNESLVDFTTRSNLLKILIKCHKSGDPPTALLQATQTYRHPLLAILATCYEPDSVVTNWLAWLSISTNIKMDIIDNYSVSPNAVSSLLENVLKKRYVRTLVEGFEIFLPDNPLYCLAEFLYNCVELNFETSIDKLKTFERIINQLNYNTSIPSIDFEYTFLTNSYWLIDTALKLVFAVLGNCFQTRAHQIAFLNILCTSKFVQNVPIDYPNFCAISKLLEALSTNVYMSLGEFLSLETRRKEIIKTIEHLIAKKQYKDALELAKFENICKEYVLNEEWLYRFLENPNVNFWDNCEKAFENAEIVPSSAAIFYVLCCSNLSDDCDKYKALKLAYKWLKLSDYSEQFVENVEQEIWSHYFALSDETLSTSTFSKHETNYLLTEIQERSQTQSRFDSNLDQIQLRHLEEAIGKILESGDIIEAVRLNKMFDHKNQEIDILLTCYELAEGKLKPYEISAEQRLLVLNRNMNLKTVPHRRRTVKSSRLSSVSSVSHDSQTIVPISEQEEANHDTLTLLETMTDRLKHGSNIASRILMCYRISVNTNNAYQDVVKHINSVPLLKTSLENDCKNKLEVIHDIFVIFKWTKSEITNFIFDELVAAINKSIDKNYESVIMWDLNLDQHFHLVLQLCSENNSILGKKLLSLINSLQESEIKENEIYVVVELLVRAHDCFNSFCNMEGISSVLRKAQAITSNLVHLKNWKLMVRLLTGIARYTEMNYIFQILKENDQFEYLLKKNFRENNGLKVALFKFLKKHCPKNQELYRIVALHFKLFSEVAELWENEALEMINNLIEIAKLEVQNQSRNMDTDFILFTNNESTKMCLHKAMTNYTHAAEYHLHGEKLIGAMQAARQAELIALQINLLINIGVNMTCKCILKLNAAQINEIISSELSFSQTKILTESYNFQADWGSILFKQSVINAKVDYLDEFVSFKPLTNTLAQDLTRRFLSEKNLNQMSVKAMKEILNKLDSVHMKYRLASELGFADVIETLLSGTQLAFLKDTVWKRGYKQL